jgi:hypothetical protein
MSRCWRTDAPVGHSYETGDDSRQVAVVLRYAFLTSNIIYSTILSNSIRCVEVHKRGVKCREYGEDVNVFVLIEATDGVCESHIVFFFANQFMNHAMIRGVKSALGKLRFSTVSRTEYESVQAAYHNDMYSDNDYLIAHAA